MPLFTLFAVSCPTSLSKTALHIAHCAFIIANDNTKIDVRIARFKV